MIDRTVETVPLPIRLGARVRLFEDSAQAVVSRGSEELRTGAFQL